MNNPIIKNFLRKTSKIMTNQLKYMKMNVIYNLNPKLKNKISNQYIIAQARNNNYNKISKNNLFLKFKQEI